MRTDNTDVGKILYIWGQQGLEPLDSRYEQDVQLTVRIPAEHVRSLHKKLVEATCGRIVWEYEKELSFIDKE